MKTEAEAKKTACPLMLQTGRTWAQNGGVPKRCRCIASECMAWRPMMRLLDTYTVVPADPKLLSSPRTEWRGAGGYCGLAGPTGGRT